MSTIKEAQDYMNQVKGLLDSMSPKIAGISRKQLDFCNGAGKIPKSTIKQFESANAASKYINPDIVQSAAAVSAKLPGSAIKQLDGLGSAYKSLKPAIPKDALKGIRVHTALPSAAYSIGLDSKLTDIFDSAAMKSIRQQQKFFDSAYAVASAIKIPDIHKSYYSSGIETVGEYLNSVKGVQQIFNALPNTTIPAGLFKSSLELFSIPEPNERLTSFVDSASNIIFNEDSADIPDELADTISQEKELPEGSFKDSFKKGFKRVALSVFENIIAPFIVQFIIALIVANLNASTEDIHDAPSDDIHKIVVEERQQTTEEKKQTLELQRQTEEKRKQTLELQKQTEEEQKQTKEQQKQTKLLKQLVNNSSDSKER